MLFLSYLDARSCARLQIILISCGYRESPGEVLEVALLDTPRKF